MRLNTILVTGLLAVLVGCGPTQSMRDAIRNAAVSDVRKHVEAGFDVNGPATESGSGNCLHYAAERERGALKDDDSREARQAYMDIVSWLVDGGADLEKRNARGKTPLHLAVLNDAAVVAEMLLDYGADVNARSEPDKMTPLYIDLCSWESDKKYDTTMSELLIARGADVNAPNEDGETPLHRAAINRMPEMCRLLLEHGARVNVRDREGRTPVTCGPVNDERAAETVDLLLAHGADITIPNH